LNFFEIDYRKTLLNKMAIFGIVGLI